MAAKPPWRSQPLMRPLLALLLLSGSPLTGAGADAPTPNIIVQLTPELRTRVAVIPLDAAPFKDIIHLPGKVALNERQLARIGPSISGRVAEIKVFPGQEVRKGDVLAILNSTELSQAQAAYLKAKTQMTLQKMKAQRAKRLFEEGIISEAALREREAGLAESDVEVRALADQLSVMGMTPSAVEGLNKSGLIHSLTPVTSSTDGTIIESKISVGQIAEISDEFFTVADLSTVWVSAEAPEQDAASILLGSDAEVHIAALPDHPFIGRIIYVSDTVKPDTRTVTVRISVSNPTRRLKPEMLAEMIITLHAEESITIPAEAIIRHRDRDHVFVQTQDDAFELRPVSLGSEHSGRRKVLSGLSVGDMIIAKGGFQLYNQRMLQQAN